MQAPARPRSSVQNATGSKKRKAGSRATPEVFSHLEKSGIFRAVLLNVSKLPSVKNLSATIETAAVWNSSHKRKRLYLKSKLHRWLPKEAADSPDGAGASPRGFDMPEILRKIKAEVPNRSAKKIIDNPAAPGPELSADSRQPRFLSLAAPAEPAGGQADALSEELLVSGTGHAAFQMIEVAQMQQIFKKDLAAQSRAELALDQIFGGASRESVSDSAQCEDPPGQSQSRELGQPPASHEPADSPSLLRDPAEPLGLDLSWLCGSGDFEQRIFYSQACEGFFQRLELDCDPTDAFLLDKPSEDQATTLHSDIPGRSRSGHPNNKT
jgi:hypothetical protein